MRELERDFVHTPTERTPMLIVGRGRVGLSLAAAARDAGLPMRLASTGEAPDACRGVAAALLCVPDAAIAEVAASLAADPPPLVGHVSGATTLDALDAAGAGAAFSVHPLQTFPDGATPVAGVPCATAGSGEESEAFAAALGRKLGMRPFSVPDERRAAYHAAACIASNFLVALEESAAGLLDAAGIEGGRELLGPLVLTTASNWAEQGAAALTGPIARGDAETIEKHRAALAELAPELVETYSVLAERTTAVASGASATIAPASRTAAPGSEAEEAAADAGAEVPA